MTIIWFICWDQVTIYHHLSNSFIIIALFQKKDLQLVLNFLTDYQHYRLTEPLVKIAMPNKATLIANISN
jgi:hypothetical protein